jgi:hypothetical protein
MIPLHENWLSRRFPLPKGMHEFISLLSAPVFTIWVKFGIRDMRTLLMSMFEFHENCVKERSTFVIGLNEVYGCDCNVKPFVAVQVKHTDYTAVLFTA